METKDSFLLPELRDGGEEAAKAFLDRYADKIYRMMYFSTSSELDAEELTGETFLAFYKSLGRFEGRCKSSTWLYSIAKNLLKNYYLKRPKRPAVYLDDMSVKEAQNYLSSVRSNETPPDDLVSRKETTEIVKEVLSRLRENYRAVLIHRYINGNTTRETAAFLGKTESNTRVLLHRAGRAFARELKKLEETAGETLVEKGVV